MMSTASDLAFLFSRDLTRLGQQIEAFPNDETLWETLPGVLNPANADGALPPTVRKGSAFPGVNLFV